MREKPDGIAHTTNREKSALADASRDPLDVLPRVNEHAIRLRLSNWIRRRSGHNDLSYLYQRKANSSNVRTIVPSAYSSTPARSFSELPPSDSRPRLKNCWQKNKQASDQAGAQ